jgi:fumarylacetoacetase
MRVGDLLGSGTISGLEPGTQGSLLEASQGGKMPFGLTGGETRLFLEDGDVVRILGWAGDKQKGLVGFGECVGRIDPALDGLV